MLYRRISLITLVCKQIGSKYYCEYTSLMAYQVSYTRIIDYTDSVPMNTVTEPNSSLTLLFLIQLNEWKSFTQHQYIQLANISLLATQCATQLQ